MTDDRSAARPLRPPAAAPPRRDRGVLCVACMGNETDAEDVAQDTWLRAHRAFGRLPPDANVRAWLYRIATNRARTALKRGGGAPDAYEHVEPTRFRAAGRSDRRAHAAPWRAPSGATGEATRRLGGAAFPRSRLRGDRGEPRLQRRVGRANVYQAVRKLRDWRSNHDDDHDERPSIDRARAPIDRARARIDRARPPRCPRVARLARWLATPAGTRTPAPPTGARSRGLDAWGADPERAEQPRRRRSTTDASTTPSVPVLAAVGERGAHRDVVRAGDRAFGAALRRRHHARRPVGRAARAGAPTTRGLSRRHASALQLPIDLRRACLRSSVVSSRRRAAFRADASSRTASRAPIGAPGAARAVGQALGRNPVPIVIPCHRIVAGSGGLGGYVGGAAIKRSLLRLEGAEKRTGTWS